MEFIEKVNTFEALYAAYIAKLARLDELKTNGRYGYQPSALNGTAKTLRGSNEPS